MNKELDEDKFYRYVFNNRVVKIPKKDTITKDNRQLSQKQLKILYYNEFNLSRVSQMLYKDITKTIGFFIEEYSNRTADGYENWECPISPWGNDV